ncbi:MAG: hypothetical protein PWQ63_1315 [Methanolobus sp.]|jgi:hypothetical protein|nr:hypothetical protein [Methanolobus sp.]MDK2948155.1 hypothetical protein [Methanolobus sp.]
MLLSITYGYRLQIVIVSYFPPNTWNTYFCMWFVPYTSSEFITEIMKRKVLS